MDRASSMTGGGSSGQPRLPAVLGQPDYGIPGCAVSADDHYPGVGAVELAQHVAEGRVGCLHTGDVDLQADVPGQADVAGCLRIDLQALESALPG